MALSISEGISGKRSRFFRRESSGPKPDAFLPGGDTIFSASEKAPLGNSNTPPPKRYDWLAELKFSERDPEGVDFASLDPI